MIALPLLITASLIAASSPAVAAMKWQKRVLLVSTPDANDPALAEQRRIIARWRSGADARDLAVVEIVADRVDGVSDAAATLRGRYGLPAAGFAVVLIGKDGGAKLRETRPIAAAVLEATIDAMPMRRGEAR